MAISRRSFLQRLTAAAGSQMLGSLAPAQTAPARPAAVAAGPVLLCSNENPYGPPETALAAIRAAAAEGNRYPRLEYETLTGTIAALHRVKPEQVVLGCGSSEVLRLAVEEFLSPGKRLVQASPTFPLPGHAARAAGAEVAAVPLNSKREHDLDTMLLRCRTATGLVYLCNPNNPTGTLTPRANMEAFIGSLPPHTMVLIDEAYHHFAGGTAAYASFLDQPVVNPRVMVARTFSKIYGLAGMRIGYLIAAPEIARRLSARRLTFGVSVASARAAAAALDDTGYLAQAVARNARDRQEFMNQANARMMRWIDSRANFVMLDPQRPAPEVFDYLRQNGILTQPPLSEMGRYLRVSLGTPEEMLRFWHTIDRMPGAKKEM